MSGASRACDAARCPIDNDVGHRHHAAPPSRWQLDYLKGADRSELLPQTWSCCRVTGCGCRRVGLWRPEVSGSHLCRVRARRSGLDQYAVVRDSTGRQLLSTATAGARYLRPPMSRLPRWAACQEAGAARSIPKPQSTVAGRRYSAEKCSARTPRSCDVSQAASSPRSRGPHDQERQLAICALVRQPPGRR